jgi:hypothetical protein
MLVVVGPLLLATFAGNSAAGWFHGRFTGEEMLGYCKEGGNEPVKDFDKGLCAGFIDGFAAGHFSAETFHAFHHREEKIDEVYGRLCIPDNINRGQLARVLVQYLEQHGDKLKLPAGLLLDDALREAFPCPK